MATTITADQVKKLRDQTGAGMMECKGALTEANGDFEEANTILRKRGLASAAKKAGRSAREGLIGHRLSDDHSTGMLVEVNCESDFVARTEQFQQLISDVLAEIEQAGRRGDRGVARRPGRSGAQAPGGLDRHARREHGGAPLRALRRHRLRRAVHPHGRQDRRPGRALRRARRRSSSREEFKTLVKEIAMQIAAASPAYVSRQAVPADVLEKERSIYRAQMENSGKPANVLDKIVEGKLEASTSRWSCPIRRSIRDPKMTVKDVLAAANAALGASIAITRFARLKVGEVARSRTLAIAGRMLGAIAAAVARRVDAIAIGHLPWL